MLKLQLHIIKIKLAKSVNLWNYGHQKTKQVANQVAPTDVII